MKFHHIFPTNLFRQENGFYLHERSHGIKGTFEFLKVAMLTDDLLQVCEFLSVIIIQKEPGRTHQCFCGKKIKYRKCHRTTFRTLSLLGLPYLKFLQKQIRNSAEYMILSISANVN